MTKEEFMQQVRKDLKAKEKTKKAKKIKELKPKVYKKDSGTDKRFRTLKRDRKKQIRLHEFEYQNSIKLVEVTGISFNDLVSKFVSDKLIELGEVPKTIEDYE